MALQYLAHQAAKPKTGLSADLRRLERIKGEDKSRSTCVADDQTRRDCAVSTGSVKICCALVLKSARICVSLRIKCLLPQAWNVEIISTKSDLNGMFYERFSPVKLAELDA
jgi:hypothetical protein